MNRAQKNSVRMHPYLQHAFLQFVFALGGKLEGTQGCDYQYFVRFADG